ncbi:hypothetical protein [Lacipirellula parvula]|nr:hypothetical protein [Lacipirellula parvula]
MRITTTCGYAIAAMAHIAAQPSSSAVSNARICEAAMLNWLREFNSFATVEDEAVRSLLAKSLLVLENSAAVVSQAGIELLDSHPFFW